jgi:small subunit ribosomal protein S8
MAGHKVVEIPSSNMKKAITQILHNKGYILNFKFEETANNQGNIKVALKYSAQTKLPAMKKLIRISKPGLRKYADSKTLPRVINGLGIAILSTSKGVITDKEARNLNVGGEVICHVY